MKEDNELNKSEAIAIMKGVQDGSITPEEAVLKLQMQPFQDLGYAKVDLHREIRNGVAEVIYGQGKTLEQITGIITSMLEKNTKTILITRLTSIIAENLKSVFKMQYFDIARVGIVGDIPEPDGIGKIVVATGGTSDIPVAEESVLSAEALGNEVIRLYDVGIAGLHRLLAKLDVIMQAQVIVAVAGMEGALPSVISGLVECPVIAVPTSVGYGTSFGGISALLTMLNSCASGVSVVNIDNGFGGGYLASIINHQKGYK